MISTLVLASGNTGKLHELQALLSPLNIEVRAQHEFGVTDIEETGTTFVENALLKAKHASECTQLPALADDSGLCVEALDGSPGLFSARFAKLHGYETVSDSLNNQVLLQQMQGVTERQAVFVCCLALCFSASHPLPLLSIGRWQGEIATHPSGDYGFGYDPIFIPQGGTKSAAMLSKAEKQKHSHRGQALRALVAQLGV